MNAAIDTPILLVDDVPENLTALGALLRRDGVVLHPATSGPEALELLLAHDFALALVDVHMPGMDGFELAELMRSTERTRAVPIIFVTANPDEPHRVFQGYDAGAVDFLIKPIEARILKHKVDTFLELHAHKAQLRRQLGELEQVTGQLGETLRLVETFVAAVTHDLRSPLSAITTGAELLERRVDDPTLRNIAGRVRGAGRRMTGLIDQLQDVARVRLGSGLALDRGPADLAAIVRDVAREVQIARPGATFQIETRGDGNGHWDGARVARIVANLLGNAAQYGAPDQPVKVHVDGDRPDTVQLRVWNAGAVSPMVLPHLFEPFRRGDPGAPRSGLGLGLYIVQEIARAHGGEVGVSSSPERGTEFRVQLPRRA